MARKILGLFGKKKEVAPAAKVSAPAPAVPEMKQREIDKIKAAEKVMRKL